MVLELSAGRVIDAVAWPPRERDRATVKCSGLLMTQWGLVLTVRGGWGRNPKGECGCGWRCRLTVSSLFAAAISPE